MTTGRLEAFSDAVIAILMTIMVLELRPPEGADLQALRHLGPTVLSYVLSFVYLGIYWNNHHHMLHACQGVNGKILWANLHLLFWLSLVPFVTGWMGENHFGRWPTALYGAVMLMAAVAYIILQKAIVTQGGERSRLGMAVGGDLKGKITTSMYVAAIPLAFVDPWIADAIYVAVAVVWFLPDPRIERTLKQE